MDRAGNTVGAYVLERRLGQGGFGAVWVGRHAATGARHALKLVDVGDPDAAARLAREVEALARLEAHPHAVRVHACFALPGGRAAVAGELVEGGGDLQARLAAAGPLAWPDAARLVRQVAAAIAHAHARGVLHRDLKPANVLLDARGDARVIDLGLARLEGGERLTRTGEVLGTPTYLAPEQALGLPADARADVFGLGALLFACLTGSPPRAPGPPIDVLRRAAEEAPPRVTTLRPDIPAALADLVARATALDPARRPPSATAFLEALDAAGAGGGGGSARVRALAVLGALAVTALAAAGAALALRPRPAPDDPAPALPPAGATPVPPSSDASPAPDLRLAAAALVRADLDAVATRAAAAEAALALAAAAPPADLSPLRAATLAAQGRLVREPRWPQGTATEAEVAAVPSTLQALARLGARIGLDAAALEAARRHALDEVAPAWRDALLRAADRDRSELRERYAAAAGLDGRRAQDGALVALRRTWRPAHCRALVVRLRALLAPAAAPRLDARLAQAFDEVEASVLARGRDLPTAWVLVALDTYRLELVDRRPVALAAPHATDLPVERLRTLRADDAPPASEADAPGALASLADLDPALAEAHPGSRALAIGRLLHALRERRWDDAAATAPIALAQDPAAQDDLAPRFRWAVEPVVTAALWRAAPPPGGGPLAGTIAGLVDAARRRVTFPDALGAHEDGEQVNDAAGLLRAVLGRPAEAERLRRDLLARLPGHLPRARTKARIELACDLLACAAPDLAAARAEAEAAVASARGLGSQGAEVHALCALVLVACSGPGPDLARAERLLAEIRDAARAAGTDDDLAAQEAFARANAGGLYDLAVAEVARLRGERPPAPAPR